MQADRLQFSPERVRLRVADPGEVVVAVMPSSTIVRGCCDSSPWSRFGV